MNRNVCSKFLVGLETWHKLVHQGQSAITWTSSDILAIGLISYSIPPQLSPCGTWPTVPRCVMRVLGHDMVTRPWSTMAVCGCTVEWWTYKLRRISGNGTSVSHRINWRLSSGKHGYKSKYIYFHMQCSDYKLEGFPLKLPSGEWHGTTLIVSQHWFR